MIILTIQDKTSRRTIHLNIIEFMGSSSDQGCLDYSILWIGSDEIFHRQRYSRRISAACSPVLYSN